MAAHWMPHPTERLARTYRRAARSHDREPSGRYGRGGYGYPEGYRGSYADRPEYSMPRGWLYPPEPAGSGWPSPLHTASPQSVARRRRAYRDRDLARSIDWALYDLLGPESDRIAVYADDAVITLEGMVSHPEAAREALELAARVPGVYRVRNALRWGGERSRGGQRSGPRGGTSPYRTLRQ